MEKEKGHFLDTSCGNMCTHAMLEKSPMIQQSFVQKLGMSMLSQSIKYPTVHKRSATWAPRLAHRHCGPTLTWKARTWNVYTKKDHRSKRGAFPCSNKCSDVCGQWWSAYNLFLVRSVNVCSPPNAVSVAFPPVWPTHDHVWAPSMKWQWSYHELPKVRV